MNGPAPTAPSALLLSTIHAGHSLRSGYGLLAQYIPGAEFIHAPRADPPGGAPLFFARVARRCAFSRWYLGGSANLEWQTFQRLRAGFRGIIHSMWADHDLGFLDLAIPNKRHRFCGTFHNCPDDFPHTIRFPARLRSFGAVILMSECQRPFFRAAGVADERIHVVLHGVDTDYFTPGKPDHDDPFTVLSAGGFRRNFPLLRAVCERLAGVRDIQFEIIAPADFRSMFADLANVKFLTGISDAELLARYRAALCLLHTTEQATANNVLLEALACGTPVIADRVGGIPEYVTDDCGLLSVPGDAAALADSIERLARSPALRQAMSAAARRRAEELAWPLVAARTLDVYRSLA